MSDTNQELEKIKNLMKKVRADALNDIEVEVLSKPKYVRYALNYKETKKRDYKEYFGNERIVNKDENGKKTANTKVIKELLSLSNKGWAAYEKDIAEAKKAADIVRISCTKAVSDYNNLGLPYTASVSFDGNGKPNFSIIENTDNQKVDYNTLSKTEKTALTKEINKRAAQDFSDWEKQEIAKKSFDSVKHMIKTGRTFFKRITKDVALAKKKKEVLTEKNIYQNPKIKFVPEDFSNAQQLAMDADLAFRVKNAKVGAYGKGSVKANMALLDYLENYKNTATGRTNDYKKVKEFIASVGLDPDNPNKPLSFNEYIATTAFVSEFSDEDIENLTYLSDEELEKEEKKVKAYVKKIGKMKSEFALNYIDSVSNTHPYADALVYIKPQIRQKRTLKDVNDLFKPNMTEDVAKTVMEDIEQNIYYFGEYTASSKGSRETEEDYEKRLEKEQKEFYLKRANFAKKYIKDYELGELKYFKQNKKGDIVQKLKDDELDYMFDALIKACDGNLDKVQSVIDYYKDINEKGITDNRIYTMEDVAILLSGKFVKSDKHITKDNPDFTLEGLPYNLKWRETETRDEKAQAKGYSDALKMVHKYMIEGNETLEKGIKNAEREAKRLFTNTLNEINIDNKIKARLKLPVLDTYKIKKVVVGNFNKEIKKLESVSRSRKTLTPKAFLEVRGFDNMFISDISYSVEMKRAMRNEMRGVTPYKEATRTWSFNMGFDTFTKVVRKSGIKPVPIPESVIKSVILKNNYGYYRAALFFQLLVSNTPIDERYDYKETRVRWVRRKNVKKTEFIKTNDGNYVEVEKDPEDLAMELFKKNVVTYQREHIPDKERLRDFWEFTFKGVVFSPLDDDFINKDELFLTPGDPDSVQFIQNKMIERTIKSKMKNINFTYRNTNPRWEQLEYGLYLKDSDVKIGKDIGRKHGVTNGFSYQAPKGWIRLIEAQWNQIMQTGQDKNLMAMAANVEGFNAQDVRDEIVQELKKYESTLGTHEYDYNNFVVIMGE